MSIEFNDANGDHDGHYRRFGCVCSCSDLGHIFSCEWCDDEDWGFTFTFLYSPFRVWYKRLWDAVKYVCHPMFTMKYDSIMLHRKDAAELHKFLGEYLENLDEQERDREIKKLKERLIKLEGV